MKKSVFGVLLVLFVAVVLAFFAFGQSSGSDSDAIAAVTKLENDAVKADLAGDASFYQNYLADDWTAGTSFGRWDTKQSVLQDIKDPSQNKTNSETISDLKVRTNGDVAVATYETTYDSIIHGQHQARTIITTDVFQKQSGGWKQIAGHSSQAAK